MNKQVIRKFGIWGECECDECGSRVQVTRTEPKTVVGKVLCEGCEMNARGYADAEKQYKKDVDKMAEKHEYELKDKDALILQQCNEIMRLHTKLSILESITKRIDNTDK